MALKIPEVAVVPVLCPLPPMVITNICGSHPTCQHGPELLHTLISPLSVSPAVGNGSHLSGEEKGRDSRMPCHWKEIPSWVGTENQASG